MGLPSRTLWLVASLLLAGLAGLHLDVHCPAVEQSCCMAPCCQAGSSGSCCEKPREGPRLVGTCGCGPGVLLMLDASGWTSRPVLLAPALPLAEMEPGPWTLDERLPRGERPAPDAPPPRVGRADRNASAPRRVA